jgi:2-haloacid dehalogenase
MYSMTTTLSGHYVDFFTLGQGVLRMLATVRGVQISEAQVDALRHAMLTMPAHPDVEDGLTTLRDNGFRLVALTNSPPNPDGPSPLEHAGLGHLFDRQLSVDACRAFKPAPAVYVHACEQLGVTPADCMMVAAHVWDTIGAQSVGYSGALITRPGNAALPVPGLPQPTVIAADLRDLATTLTNPPPARG